MLIQRVFTPGLAQVAYLVADEFAGEVAVIDPRRDIEEYLAWSAERNFRIVAILETHVHADFVSGASELAAATGATIHASRLGESAFPHTPLDDGDVVPFGRLRLQALWTPGHTPEHMSYQLFDPERGPDPVALFTGDLLFVGEVGRPDLLGKEQTRSLAGHLHESIQERLAPLDDDVVVYPGHTAGSACGRQIGDAPHTTLGEERRTNYALRPQSRDEFVAAVLAGMPPAPTYYPVLKQVNTRGATPLANLPEPAPLTLEEAARLQDVGALVLDSRSPQHFVAGHLPGSRFAGLGPNFTAWTGWLAPYNRPVILVVESNSDIDPAVVELRRIGLDNVAGFVVGDPAALQDSAIPLHSIAEIDPKTLVGRIGDPSMTILDVRREDEYRVDHLPGAINAFAGCIVQGLDIPVTKGHDVAVICGTGYRSLVAISELQSRGVTRLLNVPGGMEALNAAGHPTAISSNMALTN